MIQLIDKDAAINRLLDEGMITAAIYVAEMPSVEAVERKLFDRVLEDARIMSAALRTYQAADDYTERREQHE